MPFYLNASLSSCLQKSTSSLFFSISRKSKWAICLSIGVHFRLFRHLWYTLIHSFVQLMPVHLIGMSMLFLLRSWVLGWLGRTPHPLEGFTRVQSVNTGSVSAFWPRVNGDVWHTEAMKPVEQKRCVERERTKYFDWPCFYLQDSGVRAALRRIAFGALGYERQ